jgi:Gpi18-like mannosyltransferase
VSYQSRPIRLILLLFIVTRVALVAVGTVANTRLPANEGDEFKHLLDGGPALDMWYRWDAGFYATIATYGYDWFNEQRPAEDMAFLPVYPAAIRTVMAASGCGFSPYLSTCATVGGLLVSNLALLAGCFLLYDLTRRRYDHGTGLRAVFLLLIAPSAIFFSGVYTEAVFLLLALLVFWLLDRQRLGLALLSACAAALTRSVGVALVPALLWYVWAQLPPAPLWQRLGQLIRSWRMYAALLPVVFFASYILYAGTTAGAPLAYFDTYEVIWGRDVNRAPWETLLAYFSGEPVSWFGWRLSWLDLGAFAVYVVLALVALRKAPTWGLFALAAVIIPFLSGTLSAMPRFGAVAFPVYVLLAAWTPVRWRAALVYAASIALAILFVIRFVTWNWIA